MLGNNWKTNIHVLRSPCIRSPMGGARAPWPERTPLGQQGQCVAAVMLVVCRGKKMPLCVSKPRPVCWPRGSWDFWSARVPPNTAIYPNKSCPSLHCSFLSFTSFQSAFFAGKLRWFLRHIQQKPEYTFLGNFNIWESGDSFPESSFFVSKKQPSWGLDLFHTIFLMDLLTSHFRLGKSASFFVVLLTTESILFEKKK